MKGIKKIILIWMAITISFAFSDSAFALKEISHMLINEHIAKGPMNGFVLNNYLNNYLGWKNGIDTYLTRHTVKQWFMYGGAAEDSFPRYFNHFHNPIRVWPDAGLLFPFYHPMSLILWSQVGAGEQGDDVWENNSWHDVRYRYYKALTATSDYERRLNSVTAFKGLGHLTHLVVDASVPLHTRDDIHIFGRFYEVYVEEKIFGMTMSGLNLYDNSVISMAPNEHAELPIARIVDTEKYRNEDGTPDVSATVGGPIGLAEYSHANFFSQDTAFSRFWPYPNKDSGIVVAEDIPDPRGSANTKIRYYFMKTTHGDTGYRLANVSYAARWYDLADFNNPLYPKGVKTVELDDAVYADYAGRLIPRAGSYGAGILEYFFRGKIELKAPEDGFYTKAKETSPGSDTWQFETIKFRAKNVSEFEEEFDEEGTIELVLEYKILDVQDPFQNYPVPPGASETIYKVIPVKNNLDKIPRDEYVELEFELSDPLPLNISDVRFTVIYKGTMGLEEDNAVAVGHVDASEPTPFVIFNNMDRFCHNGQWYVAGGQGIISALDQDGDGVLEPSQSGEVDAYSHKLSDIYVRYSPIDKVQLAYPDEGEHHEYYDIIEPGQYEQMYIIADYEYYYASFYDIDVLPVNPDVDEWNHAYSYFPARVSLKTGVRHQTEPLSDEECQQYGMQPPCFVRWIPTFTSYREKYFWTGNTFQFEEYPTGAECEADPEDAIP